MDMHIQTLQGLINTLQAAINAAGGSTLPINAALVQQIPALGKLLESLKKAELSISSAVLSSTSVDVTVRGTAPTFAESVIYDVWLIGTVEAGQERFRLISRPIAGSGWNFSASFATLPDYYAATDEGMTYQQSFFDYLDLSLAEFVVATFSSDVLNVTEGITFSARWNAAAWPFTAFIEYLPAGEVQHLDLAGSILMGFRAFPLIDLRAAVRGLSYNVGLLQLRDTFLRLQVTQNTDAADLIDHPFVSLVQLGGKVNLTGTAHSTFELAAPMLQGNELWAFSSAGNLHFYLFGGKEELQSFLGVHPLLLPPAMSNYFAFFLEALSFGLTPDDNFVQYLSARVGTDPWTTPLPKLKIEDLAVEWTFSFFPSFDMDNDTRLFGTIVLGEGEDAAHLEVEAAVPDFDIEAELRQGDVISAFDAISWLTGLNVDMGSLEMTRFHLWAYPDAQEYTSFTEVRGDLPFSIAGMDFNLFNIAIYYTPNSLNAELTLHVTLAEKTFSVRAITPKGDEGWLFSGTLLPGQSFTLQDFFSVLVPGWDALPPSVGALAITRFYISLDTANGDYFFHLQLQWDYQIVSYAFHIAAQFALQAVHKGSDTSYVGLIQGDFKVNNLAVTTTYHFEPASETITFEIAYKQLTLRADLVTTTKNNVTTKKLVVRFPDLPLGEMLAYLVDLAMPGRSFALSAPWDALNQVVLRNIELTIDLQTNEVTLYYPIALDLFFVEIKAISLSYKNNAGRPGVELALSASFFGQEYSIEENDPLAWDVINEPAPTVPAQGPTFLDLKYLGLGQHVSFSGNESLENVTQVLDLMKREMQPVRDEARNPLALNNGSTMRFDRASHFLIGAQFSILDTIGIGLIFNDPYLYGLALDLMGPRVGAFAGLHFELLYQRVSNDIGVFKVLLQIPDQFRQFEIGAMSITLPVVKLDIYTNGNFRIDLGFPEGGNFSNSFCVQLFPFVGYGGFYFGWLNGETATRIPQITNGSFSPVVEFGLGLHVGMGKSISKGPLSGGMSIVVEGLLEGTIGWFTPQDQGTEDATYYWLQGVVGIVGKLYGSVNFVVIKASINVEASVIFTMVMEAYATTRIGIRVRVRVSASISVLFCTVSFSFSLDLNEEFLIGSPGTPPWQIAAPTPPVNALAPGRQPRLRMQRGLYRARHERARELLASAFSIPTSGAGTRLVNAGLDWTPTKVFEQVQNLGMSLIPSLTIGMPQNGQKGPQVQIVLVLLLENTVPTTPGASQEETMKRSARAALPEDEPFNKLLGAMLRWSLHALLGRSTGDVTAADLALLKERLDVVNAGPSYKELAAFFALNFRLQISGIPNGFDEAENVGSTFFPMLPELSYSAPAPEAAQVDFSTFNPVDATYELLVQEYYDQLLVNYEAERASDPLKPAAADALVRTSLAPGDEAESLATLIFKLYFLMLAQCAVQSALDVLQSYSYTLKAGESLNAIAGSFTPVIVNYQVHAGDTVASICDEFGMTTAQLEELNPDKVVSDPLKPGIWLLVQLGVTPQTLAVSNQGLFLRDKQTLTLSGILYQVKDGDTLNNLALTFFQSGPGELLKVPANQQNPFLLSQGASFLLAEPEAQYTYFTYESVEDDTLDLLTAFVYGRVNGLEGDANLGWYKQTIADLNAGVTFDLSGVLPANELLQVPSALHNSQSGAALTYRVHRGDTLDLVARYFHLLQTHTTLLAPLKVGIEALNHGLNWNNLPAGTKVKVPAQTRLVQPADSFATLAELFELDPVTLAAGPNSENSGLLASLSVLQLPDVRYQVAITDTLALVAERFNLTLAELASNVADVKDLFASAQNTKLTITNIPQAGIEWIFTQIVKQGLADQNAGMVSRFMTSGLQLPRPDALSVWRGMYELTGQQLLCPDVSQQAYPITFTRALSATWIQFVNSAISQPGQENELNEQERTLNPGVDWTQPLPGGLHLFTGLQEELTLIIDQTLVTKNKPSLIFDPKIELGPLALPLFETMPTRYVLQTTFHWQANALPSFIGDKMPGVGAPLTGDPSIWMFTGQLLSRVASSGSGQQTFALYTSSGTGDAAQNGKEVQRYNWGSLIEITLRQVLSTETEGSTIPDTYEFAGADQTGRELLRQLFVYLNNPAYPEAGTRIYLLFQPNVETNNARGFASELVSAQEIFLLKTNFSTLTTSGSDSVQQQDPSAENDVYYATLAEPANFLRLLWEGSVTGTGGYTLRYVADGQKRGLPEQIFAASSEGKISLLVLLGSQSDSAIANRHLYTFNNCAVVGDNIDPAAQSVFVRSEDGSEKLVKLPTVPPGNAGFALARNNPQQETNPDASTLTRQLYSLLGYKVASNSAYSASNNGIPLGPTEISSGNPLAAQVPANSWYYSQVLPIAPYASSILPVSTALPPRNADPYAGIGSPVEAEIDLTFFDLYGNSTPALTGPFSVPIAPGYFDDVLDLAQWPGITSVYEIFTQGGDVLLRVDNALQVANYTPASGNGFDAAMRSASAHLERYSKIYYQFWQGDVQLYLTTTLHRSTEKTPTLYPLEKVSLGSFINAAYVFLAAALQQQLALYTLQEGDTLLSIARQYAGNDAELLSATIAALAQANRELPTSSLFAGAISIPFFYPFAYGDTLESVRKKAFHETTVPQLAFWNRNVPLNAGVDITSPLRKIITDEAHNQFTTIADAMNCSVGRLAQANANRRGILMPDSVVTVNGVSITVIALPDGSGSQSLHDLVGAFVAAGIAVTAEQIAVANASVPKLFAGGQELDVLDYVLQADDTFASLGERYAEFTLGSLAEAVRNSQNIFPAGVPLFVEEMDSVPPTETTTLATLAQVYGLSVDQLGAANATRTLLAGKQIALADRVEINTAASSALAPYEIRVNQSLDQIAQQFGENFTLTLAERNRTQRYIFLPGRTIVVDGVQVQTTASDSLESLWERLGLANTPFANLIAAIGSDPDLLRPGAFLICRLPSTGGEPQTLDQVAQTFNVSRSLLAQVNGSLRSFVRQGMMVSVDGWSLETLEDETFNSLVQRFLREYGFQTSVTAIADQNHAVPLLNAGIIFLLPPNPVALVVRLDSQQGALQALPAETIFQLTTDVIIRRNPHLVALDFSAIPKVREGRASIAPRATPGEAGSALSLWNFARNAEIALLNQIKLAFSGNEEAGTRQIRVVNFSLSGISSLSLQGDQPNFFAVRPLSTKLLDVSGVPISPFNPVTGQLGKSELTNFQSVDLEVWAGIVLPAIDLLLTPAYAVPAYRCNTPAFKQIIEAKNKLATRIAQGVISVVETMKEGGSVADARERLRQELLISLARGYATDVILQYPTKANSPYGIQKDAPRLSGQPVSSVYQSGESDTLATLATYYNVSQVGLATLLGPVVRILKEGAPVSYANQSRLIAPDDTLNSLLNAFAAPDYQSFVNGLSAPDGLFASHTTLNIYRTRIVAKNSATKPSFQTLVTYFDVPLELIVIQNQERMGIFQNGVTLSVNGFSQKVDASNNSLNLMAAALGGITPLGLAQALEFQTGILGDEFVTYVVNYVPEYNLSSAKISLYNQLTTTNMLLNLKDRSKRKKLLLDLLYNMNELEYDIHAQPGTAGYQASSWLSFIIPIGADLGRLQVLNVQPGQVEIPLPLRSYPVDPVLLEHDYSPSGVRPTELTVAKKWNYGYSYQNQGVPQDTLYLKSTFNIPLGSAQAESVEPSFFTAMAQFVSVYPSVKAKLTELLLPGQQSSSSLAATLQTFASMVESIAQTWGPIAASAEMQELAPLNTSYRYKVEMSTRANSLLTEVVLNTLTLTLDGNLPASPTGQFPEIAWRKPEGKWHFLRKVSATSTQCIYQYEIPVLAFMPLEHRLLFPLLDIIDVENASSSILLKRNENLVSTGQTALSFIYSTVETRFPNVLQPFVRHENLIPFRNANESLENALRRLFQTLLNNATNGYLLKLSAQFGYDLVASSGGGVDPVVSLLPILFQPTRVYSDAFPTQLAAALESWAASKQFKPTQGLYVFDLMIYSTRTTQDGVPLLELSSLYFDRALQDQRLERQRL